MYTGGRMAFAPLSAFANDLSTSPCTANDVQIIGTGVVTNEPCVCTGTFRAEVTFTVRNITSADRFCVAIHLPDGRDILLENAEGNSTAFGKAQGEDFRDTQMTGFLQDFPCGGGTVCFGQEGVIRGKCDPGTCATVAWSTSQGAANCTTPDEKPPGGQCRHQQICIQGFGINAECATGACAVRTLTNGCCTVDCGAALNVKITASGQSGEPCTTPLTISVKRPGETTFTNVTLNGSGCYVDPSPVQGTYTFRATDCHGCFRETTLAVCVTQITVGAPVRVNNPCSGIVTFRAGPVTGATGTVTFSFSLDGGTAVPGAGPNGDEFVFKPSLTADGGLDTSCHRLTVTASIGTSCTATSPATTFSQCVSTTTGCTPTP
jgi:hypothetical protein